MILLENSAIWHCTLRFAYLHVWDYAMRWFVVWYLQICFRAIFLPGCHDWPNPECTLMGYVASKYRGSKVKILIAENILLAKSETFWHEHLSSLCLTLKKLSFSFFLRISFFVRKSPQLILKKFFLDTLEFSLLYFGWRFLDTKVGYNVVLNYNMLQ